MYFSVLSFLPVLACTVTAKIPSPYKRYSTRYPTFKPPKQPKSQYAFASCAPPRFDNFLDSILGTWRPIGSSDKARSNDVTSGSVEEVMRSCGGAVQGVKEIQFPGSIFNQMYHNRADDGFVYFDCGSYSAGPISISKYDNDEYPLVSNLSFSTTTPKSRIIVTTSPDFSVSLAKSKHGEEISDDAGSDNGIILVEQPPSNVQWSQEVVCRMTSPSQPWMLQRAKWEKFISNSDEDQEVLDEIVPGDSMVESTWICSSHDVQEDLSSGKILWQADELTSLLRTNNVSRVVQVGAKVDSCNVQAFLRCYNDEGELKAVIMQQGKCLQ